MARFSNYASLAAALGFFVIFPSVNADAATGCRSKANAAADEWAKGRIAPAVDMQDPASDQIVVIAYGEKYFVPRNMPHDANGKLPALGQLAQDRTQVYEEEKASCLDFHGKKYYIYPD